MSFNDVVHRKIKSSLRTMIYSYCSQPSFPILLRVALGGTLLPADRLDTLKKYENRVNKMLASKATDDEFRLPGDLRPTVQIIKLIPHLEVGNFITEGYTEIFVDCIEATKIIVLNSVNLTMDRNSVAVSFQLI